MEWNALLASHVIVALYVLALGPVNILRRRRDRRHRILGYTWVAGMLYVCLSSFWIVPSGHFTWLHGLSAFTMVTVSLGLAAAIRRNARAHLFNMIGSYLGILIAFVFAATLPDRLIPRLLAEDPLTAVVVAVLVLASTAALYFTVRPRRRRIPRVRADVHPATPRVSAGRTHR